MRRLRRPFVPECRPEPNCKERYYKTVNRYVVYTNFAGDRQTVALQCKLFPEIKEIFIEDFTVGNRSRICFYKGKGYYSEIMGMLLKWAKENDYQTITGKLIASDISNRENQVRFYKKFGFGVSEPDEDNDCKITLKLK